MATFTLNWTPATSGSSGQYVQYKRTNVVSSWSNLSPLLGPTVNIYTTPTLADNIQFDFRITTVCDDSGCGHMGDIIPSEGTETLQNITCVNPLNVTITEGYNIYPELGTVGKTVTVTFACISGTEVDGYIVILSPGSSYTFSSVSNTQLTLSRTFYGINPATNYTVQVIPTIDGIQATGCQLIPYTTGGAPVCGVPIITNIEPLEFEAYITFKLNWVIGGSGTSQTIQYRIKNTVTPNAWISISPNLANTVISYTIPPGVGFLNNTLYEFRILNNCTIPNTSIPSNTVESIVITCISFLEITPTCGSLFYEFSQLGGSVYSYTVNIYETNFPNPVITNTYLEDGDPTISDTITNLYPDTTYQIELVIVIVGTSITKRCDLIPVTTDARSTCEVPDNVTYTFSTPTKLDISWDLMPSAVNGYSVRYRPVGSNASYLNSTVGVGINTVSLTVTAGVDYEGYVISHCELCCIRPNIKCRNNSNPSNFITTDYNIQVINNFTSALEIYKTDFTTGGIITGLTLPVLSNTSTSGYHPAYTDTMIIGIDGDSTLAGPAKVTIYINGLFFECIDIPAADHTTLDDYNTLSTLVVTTSDRILVTLDPGVCNPPLPAILIPNVPVGNAVVSGVCLGTTVLNVFLGPLSGGVITTGVYVYIDNSYTPLSGYTFIKSNAYPNLVYNINSTTGYVGSVSAVQC